ncbi:YidB family protein [Reyranella sp.]|uniref:YidB family protein n=1 Tax=Reyranella sp. TaxID=1929291 RepID=UPI003D0FE9FD
MGLFDILTGMRNGPRGGGGRGGGGMSPIILAALGLLAYKAVKSFNNAPQPAQHPQGNLPPGAPAAGDGLGGLLQSLGLGGASAAGSGGLGGILSGGLGDLIKQFQNSGKGELAESWVGTGQNRTIPPADLAQVLTPEQLDFLTQKTGLGREELLAGLSQQLPEVVDKLTPQGRLPSPQEIDRA